VQIQTKLKVKAVGNVVLATVSPLSTLQGCAWVNAVQKLSRSGQLLAFNQAGRNLVCAEQ